MQEIEIGAVLTCAETGKQFAAARDGCSVNYARGADGAVYSDEGVDARERRELLDRTRPFTCYLASDGAYVTGWKGNRLGRVTSWSTVRLPRWSYIHGHTMRAIRVTDVHGGKWYGRASPGVCVTLRPAKA